MGRAFQAEERAKYKALSGNAFGRFKNQQISYKSLASGQLGDYRAFCQSDEV